MTLSAISLRRVILTKEKRCIMKEIDNNLTSLDGRLGRLIESVDHPDQLDAMTQRLGIGAALVNCNAASVMDLADIGLGQVVHLPVQVSDRQGGRKSLYFINPKERIRAGFFVNGQGAAERYVTRETGTSFPAATGDIYTEEVISMTGEVIVKMKGKLEVIDRSKGHGRIEYEVIEGARIGALVSCTWWAWSFYYSASLGLQAPQAVGPL
jgi:hypothetical protein